MTLTATREFTPLSVRGVIIIFFIALALIIWQTTIQARITPEGYGPDLALALILYLGLYAPLIPGAVAVCGLGFLRDTAGVGLFGLYAGIFMLVFFVGDILKLKLDPYGLFSRMLMIFSIMLGSGLVVRLALYLFGWSGSFLPNTWGNPTTAFLVSAGVTALVGPLMFFILDSFQTIWEVRPEGQN